MLSQQDLIDEFHRVRQNSVKLCQPLALEDYGLQAMANTSPPKWHLAHTTWFFETFILKPFSRRYRQWHPVFEHLFNSYYNGVGRPFNRAQRGLLSRPTVSEVYQYRRAVDEQVMALLDGTQGRDDEVRRRIELGLHHEQQHQELILTDLKFSFSVNPLLPVYRATREPEPHDGEVPAMEWQSFEGGLVQVGADGESFCFDNETPVHRQYLHPYALATRPVTNGEILAFMADGGYQRPELWLSDGWDWVREQDRRAPLYWRGEDGNWWRYTLAGELPLADAEAACHLSYYEADAYARWAGARLPTETEWEVAARGRRVAGNLLDTGRLRPGAASAGQQGLQQLFGDVWEWTSSSYSAYPGYRPAAGAIGEYNGKFMSGQQVLRGGSCVSDGKHIRATYRNFFYPCDQWQFSGVRLARSL